MNERVKIGLLDHVVKNLGLNSENMVLLSDIQDTEDLKIQFEAIGDYDSFFVIAQNGDYVFIAGMEGIVPCNDHYCTLLQYTEPARDNYNNIIIDNFQVEFMEFELVRDGFDRYYVNCLLRNGKREIVAKFESDNAQAIYAQIFWNALKNRYIK